MQAPPPPNARALVLGQLLVQRTVALLWPGGHVSRDCAGQHATVTISQDDLRICALGGAICLGLGKEDLGA